MIDGDGGDAGGDLGGIGGWEFSPDPVSSSCTEAAFVYASVSGDSPGTWVGQNYIVTLADVRLADAANMRDTRKEEKIEDNAPNH